MCLLVALGRVARLRVVFGNVTRALSRLLILHVLRFALILCVNSAPCIALLPPSPAKRCARFVLLCADCFVLRAGVLTLERLPDTQPAVVSTSARAFSSQFPSYVLNAPATEVSTLGNGLRVASEV